MNETDGRTKEEHEPTSVQYWLSAAADVGSQIGRVLSSHTSAVLAFAGVGLYVIGLVRTIGILAAEDIPVTRGLPLAPLQDYLLRGLAVVVTPQTFLFIMILGAVLVAIFLGLPLDRLFGASSESPEEASAAEPKRSGRLAAIVAWLWKGIGDYVLPVAAVAVALIVPIAEWLPLIPGAAGMAIAALGLGMFGKDNPVAHGGDHQGVFVAMLLVSLFVTWATYAYFHPPPLDQVKISTKDGEMRTARLLYSTNQLLYLVGKEDEESGHRRIEELPLESVRSVEVADGPPRQFRNIPELLGIRFWRYSTDKDGKIELERSPPGGSSPWDDFEFPWE